MPAPQTAQAKPRLAKGDHAPVFSCPDTDGELFDFYVAVKGKPIVFIFSGDTDLKDLPGAALAATLDEDEVQVATFCNGTPEQVQARKQDADWPFRTMADADGDIISGFATYSGVPTPSIYVLDPNQRIVAITNIDDAGDGLVAWLKSNIREASYSGSPKPVSRAVPVLMVPRVLEPEDCEWLIGLWREGEKQAGQVSLGSLSKERDGVVTEMKRREDYVVKDPAV